MPTNDFKVFAGAGGANVISQALYAVQSWLSTGWTSGILPSAWINKPIRQASIISSMIAQFIVDRTGQNAVDDGTTATLEALFIAALNQLQRIKLVADLNIYVATTGSDSLNTGLTIGSPFLTIQHAYNYVQAAYDVNGFNVFINIAAGTYAATGSSLLLANGPAPGVFGNPITLLGNVSSPGTVILQTTGAVTIDCAQGAKVQTQGLTMTSGTGFDTVRSESGSIFTVGQATTFGSSGGNQLVASSSGVIQAGTSPYTITGGGASHLFAQTGGSINVASGNTVTLTGTPAFSTAFAIASAVGAIQSVQNTSPYSGAATGPRYLAQINGVINTNGGGGTYFPGGSAGSVASGGQYA